MKDPCSDAANVLLRTMQNVLSLCSSVLPDGDAQIAPSVGSHSTVKLFGPNLAHIGELTL